HMTDPHIVRKIIEKREDEIRPCVGANYCLDRIYQGGAAYCIHNAATGREVTMPHIVAKAATRKKVVVVGAGPAGLEAARVAGERGHEVVVFEAASGPGGQIRLTAQSPRRREMMSIIEWRMAQCEKHGVSIQFNT
ncbi:MAG: FAD-binding protein, partial [Mesorhizobium sp.]